MLTLNGTKVQILGRETVSIGGQIFDAWVVSVPSKFPEREPSYQVLCEDAKVVYPDRRSIILKRDSSSVEGLEQFALTLES